MAGNKRKAIQKKSFIKRIKDIWSLCFPSDQQLKEKYLSEATDLVDLERRMELWDQQRNKYKNAGLY